jgi:hypothetical protein
MAVMEGLRVLYMIREFDMTDREELSEGATSERRWKPLRDERRAHGDGSRLAEAPTSGDIVLFHVH